MGKNEKISKEKVERKIKVQEKQSSNLQNKLVQQAIEKMDQFFEIDHVNLLPIISNLPKDQLFQIIKKPQTTGQKLIKQHKLINKKVAQ